MNFITTVPINEKFGGAIYSRYVYNIFASCSVDLNLRIIKKHNVNFLPIMMSLFIVPFIPFKTCVFFIKSVFSLKQFNLDGRVIIDHFELAPLAYACIRKKSTYVYISHNLEFTKYSGIYRFVVKNIEQFLFKNAFLVITPSEFDRRYIHHFNKNAVCILPVTKSDESSYFISAPTATSTFGFLGGRAWKNNRVSVSRFNNQFTGVPLLLAGKGWSPRDSILTLGFLKSTVNFFKVIDVIYCDSPLFGLNIKVIEAVEFEVFPFLGRNIKSLPLGLRLSIIKGLKNYQSLSEFTCPLIEFRLPGYNSYINFIKETCRA